MAISPATKNPFPLVVIHSMLKGFPILAWGESFNIIEKSPLLSQTMISPVWLQIIKFYNYFAMKIFEQDTVFAG